MRILWSALFVSFALLNVYAFASSGLLELVGYVSRLGAWGLLATVDLVIALVLGMVWTWRDARRRGISPTPFIVLTVLTGSLGLLLYLVVHDEKTAPGVDRKAVGSHDDGLTGRRWASG